MAEDNQEMAEETGKWLLAQNYFYLLAQNYLRSLRRIIEDLVAHLGYRNLQHLHLQRYKEIDGERVFGAANGGIWWQITLPQIGAGHVLLALIVFQDGSWVKMSLSCEPIYGPLQTKGGARMFTSQTRSGLLCCPSITSWAGCHS